LPTSNHKVPAASDVAGVVAGEAQAQVVLGQQHLGHRVEDRGLVLAHPGQLGRGEAGHGEVAGDRMEVRQRFHPAALRVAASVIPQDGRTQYAVAAVEQGGAVHLAAEADGGHAAGRNAIPCCRLQ